MLYFTACSIGYTSNNGENCTPCNSNTYGAKCGSECFCEVNEKYIKDNVF